MSFKKIFQPVEIGLKKVLGIKKVKKFHLFDEQGFLKDGKEKLTRYALFVPFYQRLRLVVNISKEAARGGGIKSLHH